MVNRFCLLVGFGMEKLRDRMVADRNEHSFLVPQQSFAIADFDWQKKLLTY